MYFLLSQAVITVRTIFHVKKQEPLGMTEGPWCQGRLQWLFSVQQVHWDRQALARTGKDFLLAVQSQRL